MKIRKFAPQLFMISALFLFGTFNQLGVADVTAAETQPAAPPIRVALVLDKSGSTKGTRNQRMVESAAALIAALPDSTELTVVIFDSEARVLVPPTALDSRQRDKIIGQIRSVQPDGGTDMLKGLDEALRQLGKHSGAVLLVSDGFQTGAGADPLPESVWGEPARTLCRSARERNVIVHTLGIGPDVEADPLLTLFAAETGGTFYPVREVADLLGQFVQIAGQLGRYWRRSEPGLFETNLPIEVINVVAAEASHQLFRVSQTQRIPLDPVYRFQSKSVRAERFVLAPGQYAFQPDARWHSDLLRPLEFSLALASKTMPAGRDTEIVFAVRPLNDVAAPSAMSKLNVTAFLRYGDETNYETITPFSAITNGLVGPVHTRGEVAQTFAIVADLEQFGWRYRTARATGQLVSPSPLAISVTPEETTPIHRLTKEPAKSMIVALSIAGETHDHAVSLVVNSQNRSVRVSPERIQLKGGAQSIELTFERVAGIDAPSTWTGELSLSVESDDIVPVSINGAAQFRCPIVWNHLRPGVFLTGLESGRSLSIRRGGEQRISISAELVDLPEFRLLLSAVKLPEGFSATLVATGRTASGGVVSPMASSWDLANPRADLVISCDKRVLPGRYELDLAIRGSDSAVPLNGKSGPLSYQLAVEVAPVELWHRFLDPHAWTLIAPCEEQTRELCLEVVAADGGILPPFEIHADSDPPVQIASMKRSDPSFQSAIFEFSIRVPAQVSPAKGTCRFIPTGPSVIAAHETVLPVTVRPTRLTVSVPPLKILRFKGYWEMCFGWTRKQPVYRIVTQLDGDGLEACQPNWTVVGLDEHGLESKLTPDSVGNYLLSPTENYLVEFQSKYQHTEFNPSNRMPIVWESQVVPIPSRLVVSVWMAGSIAAAVLLAWLPMRLLVRFRVQTAGTTHTRLFWARLGKLNGIKNLRLALTARHICLHRKDAGAIRVEIESGEFGTARLHPGESVRFRPSDVVLIQSPRGETIRIERIPFRIPVLSSIVELVLFTLKLPFRLSWNVAVILVSTARRVFRIERQAHTATSLLGVSEFSRDFRD